MKKQILLFAVCSLQFIFLPSLWEGSGLLSAQSSAVPFTLEDRDRIIQMQITMNERFESVDVKFESMDVKFESMDVKFESMQKEMNTHFESQQRQIDDIKTLFYWGFGMMMSLMLFLLGYTIWDRKTVTEPIREHTQSLIQTLREYAREQPKLADILRSYGLL